MLAQKQTDLVTEDRANKTDLRINESLLSGVSNLLVSLGYVEELSWATH